MVVRDVHTRWNYTHAMIRRALLLKEVRSPVLISCFESTPLHLGHQCMDFFDAELARTAVVTIRLGDAETNR